MSTVTCLSVVFLSPGATVSPVQGVEGSPRHGDRAAPPAPRQAASEETHVGPCTWLGPLGNGDLPTASNVLNLRPCDRVVWGPCASVPSSGTGIHGTCVP